MRAADEPRGPMAWPCASGSCPGTAAPAPDSLGLDLWRVGGLAGLGSLEHEGKVPRVCDSGQHRWQVPSTRFLHRCHPNQSSSRLFRALARPVLALSLGCRSGDLMGKDAETGPSPLPPPPRKTSQKAMVTAGRMTGQCRAGKGASWPCPGGGTHRPRAEGGPRPGSTRCWRRAPQVGSGLRTD